MMWYWGGGVHWWGWLLGVLGMVVFWGLVIWAIWYLVGTVVRRADTWRSDSDRRSGDAKRILDERLARGEIDAEEYRRIREVMDSQAGHGVGGREPAGTRERP